MKVRKTFTMNLSVEFIPPCNRIWQTHFATFIYYLTPNLCLTVKKFRKKNKKYLDSSTQIKSTGEWSPTYISKDFLWHFPNNQTDLIQGWRSRILTLGANSYDLTMWTLVNLKIILQVIRLKRRSSSFLWTQFDKVNDLILVHKN